MFASALGLLALSFGPPQGIDELLTLTLLAHDGQNFAPAGGLRASYAPAVLALSSRSSMQPRSVARREGHVLRLPLIVVPVAEIHGDAETVLTAQAVAHASDVSVLWAEDPTADLGPALYRVGAPQLPRSARGVAEAPAAMALGGAPRSALPELARWDGLPWAGDLRVEPGEAPADYVVLTTGDLFARGGLEAGQLELAAAADTEPWLRATLAPHSHYLVPTPRGAFELRLGGSLDRLQFVDASPVADADLVQLDASPPRVAPLAEEGWAWRRGGVGPAQSVPQAVRVRGREHFEPLGDRRPRRGEMLEVVFQPPPPADEGQTWSLVVSLVRKTAGLGSPRPQTIGAVDARFVERAAELGLGQVHFEGPDLQLDIRPTMGPGLAFGDVDGDGLVDLYALQGGGREGSEVDGNRLFVNRSSKGQLRFVEAGDAGAPDTGWGMGALFFDGDGDGRLDLYVANYGPDSLWHNLPRERAELPFQLTDVSAAAGLVHDLWSAGVTAGDPDLDGDLDLYVASYLRYDEAALPDTGGAAFLREDPPAMLPYAFPGERNVYLENQSDGGALKFVDTTEAVGLVDAQGRGMQPVFWDFDRDGLPDLYVANDVSINQLFHNLGEGRFREVSFAAGMDDPRGGMGVAVGDVDLDGDEDLVLTNWQLESNALYINHLSGEQSQRTRVPSFRDLAVELGIGRPSVGLTGWGAVLDDLDGDGDLDLAVANGYTSPDYESTGICVGQPAHLFENDGEGHFALVSDEWAPDFAAAWAWRALGACDFAQNGALDLVMSANNGPLAFFENRRPAARWLGLRLRARGKNTHAIGAEVTIRGGERLLRRTLAAGTSYLVGNAPELWFGLGDMQPERIEVRWPDGQRSEHAVPEPNRFHVLRQPEPEADGAR
ncbi:MAG: hypothetical protein GC161_00755 [Planctomycetaceae bacterium]|nr:hypothetical protein [Planctomycetaceae bacterium]